MMYYALILTIWLTGSILPMPNSPSPASSLKSLVSSSVQANWVEALECVQVTTSTPTCNPFISSVLEWTDGHNPYQPVPASNLICGCNVYDYLDVTPVCAISNGKFVLGGEHFNKCPGRCLNRTDFTFPQGPTNVVEFPDCTQTYNCITITPSDLMSNGGSMTAYYQSNTENGAVVTIIRFTYNGLGLHCNNIYKQVIQHGKIYKDITVRRKVTCPDLNVHTCEANVNIPQQPDECLLEAFMNTVNIALPCGGSGYSASTINISAPAVYQWTHNEINIPQNYSPSVYCLSGSPNGIYCAKITDNNGCMAEPCRIHQSPCSLGVILTTNNQNIHSSLTNCSGSTSYQWSRWTGTNWVNTGGNTSTLNTSWISGEYRLLVTCGTCRRFANIMYYPPPAPLPVDIIFFTANQKSACGHITLDWRSASEKNSSKYIIERSRDGGRFTPIGEVASLNRSEGSIYQYTDENALKANSHYTYRLLHADMDGMVQVFEGGSLRYNCHDLANLVTAIFPNPTSGELFVDIQKNFDNISTQIKTSGGTSTSNWSYILEGNQIRYDFSLLSRGYYILEIKLNHAVEYHGFIKI
ncbi:MAG: hypothetical protein IPN97_09475 [Saprospiraceae bacterium]|nr:hypothetical protein [Saprospiraceae bacterium]